MWAFVGGRYNGGPAMSYDRLSAVAVLSVAMTAHGPPGRNPRARQSAGDCDEQPKSPASREQNTALKPEPTKSQLPLWSLSCP